MSHPSNSLIIERSDMHTKAERVYTSVPASVAHRLRVESDETGYTLSEVVRRAIIMGSVGELPPETAVVSEFRRRPRRILEAEPLIFGEMADSCLGATEEERKAKCEPHNLALRPATWRVLTDEAAALGISRSLFLSWVMAFYRNHQEEARSLALPWQ